MTKLLRFEWHEIMLHHSEARNDHGRRVTLEFKKICDETAPF